MVLVVLVLMVLVLLVFLVTRISKMVTSTTNTTNTTNTRQGRRERLQASTCRTVYHQTDDESAQAILRSKRFNRGSSGIAGPGIYFAETPEATQNKARKRGHILRCTILLGNMLELGAQGDSTLSIEKMRARGYDSASVARELKEYVVYGSDQIIDVRTHTASFREAVVDGMIVEAREGAALLMPLVREGLRALCALFNQFYAACEQRAFRFFSPSISN